MTLSKVPEAELAAASRLLISIALLPLLLFFFFLLARFLLLIVFLLSFLLLSLLFLQLLLGLGALSPISMINAKLLRGSNFGLRKPLVVRYFDRLEQVLLVDAVRGLSESRFLCDLLRLKVRLEVIVGLALALTVYVHASLSAGAA